MTIKRKFSYPYLISMGETYLCMDMKGENQRRCEKYVDEEFRKMSDFECNSLHASLGPNAKEYITKNADKLKGFKWFQLYTYFGKEYKDLFENSDVSMRPASINPKNCQAEIKASLQQMLTKARKDYLNEVNDFNPSFFAKGFVKDGALREKLSSLCKEERCNELFSKEVTNLLNGQKTSGNRNETNAAMTKEMEDIVRFYRDVKLHTNLSFNFCTMSNSSTPSINTSPLSLPGTK
jgi:hypothetical protein